MIDVYYAVASNMLNHSSEEREQIRKKIVVPDELTRVSHAFEELIMEEEILISNALAEKVNNRIATYYATLPLSKKL